VTHTSLDPAQALELLTSGNERWARGYLDRTRQSAAGRDSLVASQSPSAVVLSCIDSRVPPELIFYQGLGQVLVVRSAAHTLDEIVLGSVEFGPCVLGTQLILVLGHQRCGAVGAAVEAFQHDRWPPGRIESVVEALRPAYKMAAKLPGDLTDNVGRAHVRLTAARLKTDAAFAGLLRADKLRILSAWYSLDAGTVEVIA
jgi:carbonic anhydrase